MDYNNNAGIDLHIHSTASDGTFSPSEILALARDFNLAAIAITDHDTINGSKEALGIGIPPSLKFLTGVEISASLPPSFPNSGSLHILGYSINIDAPLLNKTLGMLQEARKNRNPRIVDRLNSFGIDLSMNELLSEVGDAQLGRPHIARLMVKKGYVESIKEAFDKYLGKGKPAYVDKYRVDCFRAIEVILDAGGIPVIAHPFLLNIGNIEDIEELVITLKARGLKGIEVYYPEHSQDNIAKLEDIANRYELLMTGGTDFHGSLKPEIKMGSGKGNFFVPYILYERLMESIYTSKNRYL
ncbi:MAG: PHP domain-containing protein [Deltaproteobacteria bacterium]|nr:PHP domain-containing protein [Deltaproteobacteria bacterium]